MSFQHLKSKLLTVSILIESAFYLFFLKHKLTEGQMIFRQIKSLFLILCIFPFVNTIATPESGAISFSDISLSKENIRMGRDLLQIIREVDTYHTVKKVNYLNLIAKNIDKDPLFSHLSNWANSLSQIVAIKNEDQFIKYCPKFTFTSNDYYDYFTKRLVLACFNIIEQSLSRSHNKNREMSSQHQKWLSDNIGFFLKEKNKKFITSLFKKYKSTDTVTSQISQIISDYYISNNIVPESKTIDIIKVNGLLKGIVQNVLLLKKRENSQKELITNIKSIEKTLKKSKGLNINLTPQIDHLIKLTKENGLSFSKKEYLHLIGLARSLQTRKQHALSKRFLQSIIPFIKGEEYQEAIFALLWCDISLNNYTASFETIQNYQLKNNPTNLTSKILFWMGYIMLQTKQNSDAITYFNATISAAPLSFYSVMAAKMLAETPGSSAHEKNNKLIQFFEKKEKEAPTAFNEKNLNINVKNYIKRRYLWKELRFDPLMNLEHEYLFKLSEKEFFASSFLTTQSPSEKKFLQILTSAKILMNQGDYLKSFNYLNQAVIQEKLPPNRALLMTLFPQNYQQYINKLSDNLDPTIILALIRQESAFNTNAHSSAGARGLMQVLPRTARTIQRRVSTKDLHNPTTNITIGIQYFKRILKRYNGNLVYSLAAYNAGETHLNRWINENFNQNSMLHTIESIPYRETRQYVQLIFRNIFFYKILNDHKKEDSNHTNKIFDISLGLSNSNDA